MEPFGFTTQFIQWEPQIAQKWIDEDPLEILKMANQNKMMAQVSADLEKKANPFKGFLNPEDTVFTMDEIKGKWPKGIKGDAKEFYLADAEFEAVLGMTKEAWGELKMWKRENKKKEVGLF